MGLIKAKRTPSDFCTISKIPIHSPQLSFKAKGILTYLMSHSDNWKTRIADLENHSTDGEKAIRAGLQELRKAGYAKLMPVRVKGKIVDWNWEISDTPIFIEFSPDAENRHLVEKPDAENGDLVNEKKQEETSDNQASAPDAYFLQVENRHSTKKEISKKDKENKKEGEPQERQNEQPPAPPVIPSRNSFPVFGEFKNVYLSEDERQRLLTYLKTSFPTLNGKADIALHGLIESMSAWQINHPERPISNHYAGLRSWIDADRKKGIVPGQPAKKYEKDDRTPFRKTLDAVARLRFDENDNIIILEDGQDDKTGNVESCYPDFSILSGKIQTAV